MNRLIDEHFRHSSNVKESTYCHELRDYRDLHFNRRISWVPLQGNLLNLLSDNVIYDIKGLKVRYVIKMLMLHLRRRYQQVNKLESNSPDWLKLISTLIAFLSVKYLYLYVFEVFLTKN